MLGCEEVEEVVWFDGLCCASEFDIIVAGVGVVWVSGVLFFEVSKCLLSVCGPVVVDGVVVGFSVERCYDY